MKKVVLVIAVLGALTQASAEEKQRYLEVGTLLGLEHNVQSISKNAHRTPGLGATVTVTRPLRNRLDCELELGRYKFTAAKQRQDILTGQPVLSKSTFDSVFFMAGVAMHSRAVQRGSLFIGAKAGLSMNLNSPFRKSKPSSFYNKIATLSPAFQVSIGAQVPIRKTVFVKAAIYYMHLGTFRLEPSDIMRSAIPDSTMCKQRAGHFGMKLSVKFAT